MSAMVEFFSSFGAQATISTIAFILLAVISYKDLKSQVILDTLLVLLGLLAILTLQVSVENLIIALLLGGVGMLLRLGYRSLYQKPGLGWGDVKMLAVCGLWLDTSTLAIFLILSGIFGMVTAGVWLWYGYGKRFPFAPSLALALALILGLNFFR